MSKDPRFREDDRKNKKRKGDVEGGKDDRMVMGMTEIKKG